LYSATVPVADYSESERSRAIRSGLEQVLVRLTGRSDIAGEPRVARLLANSAAYAYEFGYVELQPRELGQGLRVAYTRGEIDSYLRQHQLPVWPQQRLPLLVWVLRESAGQSPAFVQPEEDQALYDTLGSLFDGRGMPVRY